MSIKSNLVVLLSSLLLSCPVAFAEDVKEPPAPGSDDTSKVAKLTLASDLLADGIKQYNAKNFALAFKRLDTVVGLEPDNLAGNYYRGLTNKKLGKANTTKKDFEKTTSLEARTKDDFQQRGKAFQECGKKAQADADFAKAKTLKI